MTVVIHRRVSHRERHGPEARQDRLEERKLDLGGVLRSVRRIGPAHEWKLGDRVAAESFPDVPLHFTAFHPDWKMMDRQPTPPDTLQKARATAATAVLRYVCTGNVHDPAGPTTCCHRCGAVLIGRDIYEQTAWNLSADRACRACGMRCTGLFETRPGRWGSRRRPVTE